MKRYLLTTLLTLVTVLFAATSWAQHGWPADFWAWRQQLILLSGLLLMAIMAAAMVLATRAPWLENRLAGLDKVYRIHRRLGIASGLLLAAHWLLKLSPPLAKTLGLAAPMLRHGARHGGGFSLVGLAHGIGSWSAYAVLALVLLSLLRLLPYGFWRKLHTLFAPLFLLGAFHGAILLPGAFWLTPVGALYALTMLAGGLAALWVVAGRLGHGRRHAGTIVSVQTPQPGVVEVCCQMDGDWPGHRAGQFARVTFDAAEGAHPFSIANGDNPERQLRFLIKALGDYTGRLADTLAPGMAVTMEGPYGRFLPAPAARPQAWVAGGIGITPFMAWLDSFAGHGRVLDQVDFYYCVPSAEQALQLPRLQAQCQAAGVRLHLLESRHGARLRADMLPEVDDVWFCGPQAMGQTLADDLARRPGRKPRFHAEMFAMR